MDDDFNTAGALGFLFELVRAINQARSLGASPDAIIQAQNTLREFATVLGLNLEGAGEHEMEADPFVDLLVEIRRKLRGEKLWDLSDDIRDRLTALGVTLEDSKEGTTWRWD
jgi:cysteinyl-tRNA synthetase